MRNLHLRVLLLLWVVVLAGCQGAAGPAWPALTPMSAADAERSGVMRDRAAILKMAGTFKVSFDFQETLPMRPGYELAKPYHTQAEELVVVVADQPNYISLQHLLVVRHDGETHVINHWRQDWAYKPTRSFRFVGDQTWAFDDCDWSRVRQGTWVQLVYNVADSPRYASFGRWRHSEGTSTWTGSQAARPLPLRESSAREDYSILKGVNRVVVGEQGWVHFQDNTKVAAGKGGAPDSPVALELGMNRYLRIPDKDFEQAHDYWKNTEPFWQAVRQVWAEVFERGDTLTLRRRWKGDPLFTHLFGLSDEYWGTAELGDARPRIRAIIEGFVVRGEDAAPAGDAGDAAP